MMSRKGKRASPSESKQSFKKVTLCLVNDGIALAYIEGASWKNSWMGIQSDGIGSGE